MKKTIFAVKVEKLETNQYTKLIVEGTSEDVSNAANLVYGADHVGVVSYEDTNGVLPTQVCCPKCLKAAVEIGEMFIMEKMVHEVVASYSDPIDLEEYSCTPCNLTFYLPC